MNLEDKNYHWKKWFDWILDSWWDKILQSQKWKFWEKEPKKLKRRRILNIRILNFTSTIRS